MMYSRIAGTGSYLPKRILTNKELEQLVNTTDQWIIERTGIHERRIAADQETTMTMAVHAAREAIAAAQITPQKIDLIIVATSTPDHWLPSIACLVQNELELHECPAFDIGAACAGFNYALTTANNFIGLNQASCALVIGSEVMSRIVDWKDRNTCVLFGDGAGAVILISDSQPGILDTKLAANGAYHSMLYATHSVNCAHDNYIRMLGGEVFKIAIIKLGDILEKILIDNNLRIELIDWLIPHQANLRIIQALCKRINLPVDKVVLTLQKYGNTSAASIPISLHEAINDGRIQRGQTILLESFGGGFTWGAALIKY